MTTWRSLEPADESIFTTAPIRYHYVAHLDVAPERVWQSLVSDRSVADWGPGVKSLTWTSPRPFGVDTTREVVLALSAVTVRERFFRFDEGKRFSFFASEVNRPGLRRFAEDCVVEPNGDGTKFTWTIAIEPQPRATPVVRLLGPVNKQAFGQLIRGAKGYFAKHP